MNATMKFVGHAGFLLTYGDTSVLADPWLFGSAFNDGWDLLTPSVLSDDDAEAITHIWISHEHPDHFSPASMRHIMERVARPPTVLFQKTNDRRVLKWCEKAGFQTRELEEWTWFNIGRDYAVMLGKCGLYDSWLATRAGGITCVNLNDCALFEPHEVARLARQIGTVDCLVTQFSYANWIGNPADTELRTSEARLRVERILPQITGLKPQHVVPAASFVWFSHEENVYLNDLAVPVRTAVSVIEQAGSNPVVLAPGDEWLFGSDRDNGDSIAFYEDLTPLEARALHHARQVELDHLASLCEGYMVRVHTANSRLLVRAAVAIGWLRGVRIYLWDHDYTVAFHPLDGLTMVGSGDQGGDVSMGSDSLAFIFRFDWGVDSLSVNGRFRSTTSSISPIYRAFGLGVLNNAGHALAFKEITDRSMWAVLTRKIRRRIRQLKPFGGADTASRVS